MPLTIYDEVLRRDFSKRQVSIIQLIMRLSIRNEQPYARIPKLKCFQLCGLSPTKIQHELQQLVELNVLEWDRNEVYKISKNFSEWKVKVVKSWDEKSFQELLEMNSVTGSRCVQNKLD